MSTFENTKQNFERLPSEGVRSDFRRTDRINRVIEKNAFKIPTAGFMGLAVGSMILSAALEFFSKKKEHGNFVGLWAPSFLMMGIYRKLIQIEQSDRLHQDQKKAA